jgi:hypothetical protein
MWSHCVVSETCLTLGQIAHCLTGSNDHAKIVKAAVVMDNMLSLATKDILSCIPDPPVSFKNGGKKTKTYNSGYSLVVTHLTTNPPVRCLNRAERTGSLVFNVLWSYVEEVLYHLIYILSTNDLETGSI